MMTRPNFYVCNCFYTDNYFIKDINVHVTYHNKKQFFTDYEKVIQRKDPSVSLEQLAQKLEREKVRRENLGQESLTRRRTISNKYEPLHPHLYRLKEEFLQPEFLELVKYSRSDEASAEGLINLIHPLKKTEKVYAIPVFTEEFCREFVEELKHFEKTDLPKGRPNTMNNYGILLDELGFDENLLDPLRENYLLPLTQLLFPEVGGDSLDSHKAFVVTYKMGQDEALDYHYDNAEVTINVSLSGEFEEGSLYFGAMRTERQQQAAFTEYIHRRTYGLIHRGQHMHGALPITEGERYNLIVWMRSSQVRNQLCPMCDKKPHLVKTVGRGDGFTSTSVDVCHLA